MARYSYELGKTQATMVNLESFTTGVQNVPPRGMAVDPVSVRRTGADGLSYGDGYPSTVWHFDVITGDQLDDILALIGTAESGPVYLRTRTEDGKYHVYRAIMHRPVVHKDRTPAFVERWKDVDLRFTRLEEQTETPES